MVSIYEVKRLLISYYELEKYIYKTKFQLEKFHTLGISSWFVYTIISPHVYAQYNCTQVDIYVYYEYEGCPINLWTTFINQKRASEYFYNAYVYQRETFSNRKI